MRAFTIVRAVWVAAALIAAVPAIQAQSQPQPPAAPAAATQDPSRQDQTPVIRRSFDLITTDVIVRDGNGQFVADLKKDDFEVFEDGVQQEVVTFVLTHGGRVFNQTAAAPPPAMEGIILPPARPTNDAAGRIFIIFVDDLHLDFPNTGRIRQLFKQISTELIHEGDMFGIVSTGPSSIAIDLTYDRKRLTEAEKKISGGGLKPNEILEAPVGAEGVAEVNYRAHVAFSTANDLMRTLEQVHNRRKAFIYLSNGYDLNPFKTTREKNEKERWQSMNGSSSSDSTSGTGDGSSSNSDMDPFGQNKGNRFTEADLAAQLSEVTRAANRANATIYTIDSRGLVGLSDMDQKIDMTEWNDYVLTSQNTLRTLADLTGGFAIVNQNDFTKGLKKIDAETSDYYLVGYYSNNPDPLKRRRKIEVKVKRSNANAWFRQEYSMRPTKR
jgi:VWFA-related protein